MTLLTKHWHFGLAVALTGMMAAPVAIAGSEDSTIRAALTIEIANLDNYYDTAGSATLMSRQIWDALFYIEPETSELKHALAASHTYVDDTTLEIELRRGVLFHDGRELKADDVVYTLNWIRNSDNGVRTITSPGFISEVERIDDYRVRISMKSTTALALRFLSVFPIYPAGTYDTIGEAAMNTNPVGTGPFKVTSVQPGQEYVLQRFENHYADSPKGAAQVENLIVRIIPEPSTQLAELVSGGIDWIYAFGADQVENLGRSPNIEVGGVATSRMMYMVLDAAGRTGPDSPFANILVRQAVAHAVDRPTLVAALVQGGAQALDAFCYPDNFGCPADVVTYDYDPDRARALLAEAGYPNGFSTTISAWRDRPIVEAVMGFLSEVGITTDLNFSNLAPLREQWEAGTLPVVYGSIGSQLSDVGNFVPTFFGLTARDLAQDEQVAEWLKLGNASTDPEVRRNYSHLALQRIAEQAYAVPLFSDNTNFAVTRGLTVPIDSTGMPHFYRARWQ
jgi:peptide/nickel transport system substrate-binding protein